jgi:hypothetical protein
MSKEKKVGTADRSIKVLRPEEFTYPEAATDVDKPKGKRSWNSVKHRQLRPVIDAQRPVEQVTEGAKAYEITGH